MAVKMSGLPLIGGGGRVADLLSGDGREGYAGGMGVAEMRRCGGIFFEGTEV
jgi:hypothetical protein